MASNSHDHFRGEVSGPNGCLSFWQPPSHPVVCVWRITVTSGRKFQLNFNYRNMPTSKSRLRVLDGINCGGATLSELSYHSSIPPNGIVSNSKTMTVVYTETIFEMSLTNIYASFSEIIPEITTTTETSTTPIRTAPGSSMKPTDGVIPEVTTTMETGATPIRTAPGSSMKPTDGGEC
ncbi:unnamed protein product [Dicrocoelium dendriticum]|nr:unnamed protein product [Dicrocoelium dendriticum]